MEIQFIKEQFEDLDNTLQKEWIESDNSSNYSSSTIVGMNTRKRHGLYVAASDFYQEPLVIISHFEEEIYEEKKQYSLYTVEYDSNPFLKGLQYQKEFHLDPFPTYIYQIGELTIRKSICFLPKGNCLLISYKIDGIFNKEIRLVIRPYFAYRTIMGQTDRDMFDNEEFYFMDQQLRFLPNPDAPEVFIQHSEGQFINSPTWYHNFFYRNEQESKFRQENLLNPGIFEFNVSKDAHILISVATHKSGLMQLEKLFEIEQERRLLYNRPSENSSEVISYLFRQLDKFKRVSEDESSYFVTDLMQKNFNLSVYCLFTLRLLRSKIKKNIADEYFKGLKSIISKADIHEILMGLHSEIAIDAASPFLLIFFLYEYHLRYNQGPVVQESIRIMLEIIDLIRRNRLQYFQMRSNKLLERVYQKSDLQPKNDYQLFYPLRQNFILNVLWYNAIMMVRHLAELNNVRVGRIKRWPKIIKNRFFNQYFKSFSMKPAIAINSFKFVLHPAIIYSITLPYPILKEKDSQLLLRMLMTQFLTNGGIKFPTHINHDVKFIISPLLSGEYLDGWNLLMKDKKYLVEFFMKIGEEIKVQLSDGVLGYIPSILRAEDQECKLICKPSGVATAEALYFLHRLNEIRNSRMNNN